MDEEEFDKFADEYQRVLNRSIRLSGSDIGFFTEYKVRDAAALAVKQEPPLGARILDFGAGVCNSVPYFRKYFPQCELSCTDVSRRSLALGESRFGDRARFVHFDGSRLPFDDETFDLVFSACVFHHIAPEHHIPLLTEIYRVLSPHGLVIVFEHNPINPLTVYTVKHCPFDENAQLIRASTLKQRIEQAGLLDLSVRYRVFFPNFLKPLRAIEKWMTWFPLGAQYYVAGHKEFPQVVGNE